MSDVTWVNHASFVLSSGPTRLLCDPWIEGSLFDDGWELLSPTVFTWDDFRGITHLWFSHEHPDHFNPMNLERVPQDVRRGITVLYQKTRDRKVVDCCRRLGFTIQELTPLAWVELSTGFRVLCGTFPFYDSWLLIDADGTRFLDVNDCRIDSPAAARRVRRHTGPVDVLLTQFSSTWWSGNPDELARRRTAARKVLENIAVQSEIFEPRYVVPCASHVYFSHEDNDYMNDAGNSIGDAADFIRARTRAIPLVLYPGDQWVPGAPHDNEHALTRYATDAERAPRRLHRARAVDLQTLQRLSACYLSRMRTRNSRILMWVMCVTRFLPSVVIHIEDLAQVVAFDLRQGLRVLAVDTVRADITLRSGSLAQVFEHDWGMDNLYVNGCFRVSPGGLGRFLRAFSLGMLNNSGRTLGWRLFMDVRYCWATLSWIVRRAGG